MIRFVNVSKRYPTGQEALNQVSFALAKGEMAFLTGHSGAGKSTLLKLIMALELATAGQVWVDEKNLQHLPARHIPALRRSIGVIFQNPQLIYNRSVFDNVALPLVVAGYGHQEVQRRVRAALDKVGLLRKEKLPPLSLSAGEQQRVGIARAVVNKPTILLADEPTGNLDPDLAAEIMRLFSAFNQLGTSVLIATHDLALIAKMPHRVLPLKNGQLVEDSVETS